MFCCKLKCGSEFGSKEKFCGRRGTLKIGSKLFSSADERLAKFLKCVVYNCILGYLKDFHSLCDNQYGFRKKQKKQKPLILPLMH